MTNHGNNDYHDDCDSRRHRIAAGLAVAVDGRDGRRGGTCHEASLNNLILEIQTDTEASQFIRDKKIKRIHKVQRLIADRYATAGSCAFFRITCNVLDGVLVAAIASLCDAPLWAGLLVGFVFTLVVAVISLLVRPRSAGASKTGRSDAEACRCGVGRGGFDAVAKIGGQKDAKRHSNDLSDDEELEKIQLEQGRATIDRLVEANDSTLRFPKCCATY